MHPEADAPPTSAAARWIATWFGCGHSPRAPGTVGSIAAVPVHVLLMGTPLAVHVAAVVLSCIAGVWAAQRFAMETGSHDPQQVVIDEVTGTLIALTFVRGDGVWPAVVAVLGFRLFDIWKPWPIRHLERARPVGLGIMLDDWGAGLLAGALAWAVPL